MKDFEYAIQLLRNKRHYYIIKYDKEFKLKQKNWNVISQCEDRISDLNKAILCLIETQFN